MDDFMIRDEYIPLLKTQTGKAICREIRHHGCVISGSRILSAVVGTIDPSTFWTHDPIMDINVYVPFPRPVKFEKWIVRYMGGVELCDPDYTELFPESTTYMCPDRMVRVIPTPVISAQIRAYIWSTSDLDICASSYDGVHMYVHPGVFSRVIHPRNQHNMSPFEYTHTMIPAEYDGMFHAQCRGVMQKRTARAFKYALRGFEVVGFHRPHDLVRYHILAYQYRVHVHTMRDTMRTVVQKYKDNVPMVWNAETCIHLTYLLHYGTSPVISPTPECDGPRVTVELLPWIRSWVAFLEGDCKGELRPPFKPPAYKEPE